jgi:mRNA-degrading endonuclease RelE of RelBE toxin-antitoxin system
MNAEVQWSDQVKNFGSGLPPDARKKVRAAIRGLASDRGDIKPLVDELLGYSRARAGEVRIIYRETFESGVPVRKCLFAERRNIVYELFRKMVLDDIR